MRFEGLRFTLHLLCLHTLNINNNNTNTIILSEEQYPCKKANRIPNESEQNRTEQKILCSHPIIEEKNGETKEY